MKITFIHHSSFMVEFENAAFLFDYFQGDVPDTKGKPLVVFASHSHGDHFSPAVFSLKQLPAAYVFSSDIRPGRVPDPFRDRVIFMGPRQERELSLPEGLKIATLRSTDLGVAFLLEYQGKRIYHAGDLNNWYWSGEPEEENHQMEENYRRELESIRGIHLDAAFVPLDPRQEKDFYRGMDDFMRIVGADHVFPMHFWGDFSVIPRLKQMDLSLPYRSRIVDIHREGETFER